MFEYRQVAAVLNHHFCEAHGFALEQDTVPELTKDGWQQMRLKCSQHFKTYSDKTQKGVFEGSDSGDEFRMGEKGSIFGREIGFSCPVSLQVSTAGGFWQIQ